MVPAIHTLPAIHTVEFHRLFCRQNQISLINFVNTLATVKNRSRKPMTITICNQILLKISAIDENEIDDTAYCYA